MASIKTPSVWGKTFREMLLILAYAYDEEKREIYDLFYGMLPHLLPCDECGLHCQEYIEHNPPTYKNLVKWTKDFRNAVQERLGKDKDSLQSIDDELYRKVTVAIMSGHIESKK